MAAKDVIFGGEARARMVEGVNILANAENYVFCCHFYDSRNLKIRGCC